MPSPKNCRVLREKYGFVLKEHPIIEQFMEGRRTPDDLNKYLLQNFHWMIDQKGFGPNEFFDMERLLFLNADAARRQGHTRFSKLMKRLKLDVAPRELKIDFIKKTPFNKFLDMLSVSNGLLIDLVRFQRWKDASEDRAVYHVETTGRLLDLWPPVNARSLFEKVYRDMQRSITLHNMNYWAVMMYFTIVAAHLFSDGNGRVARHAYFLLRSGQGVLDEEHTRRRVKGVKELCQELGVDATKKVCLNNGNRDLCAAVLERSFLEPMKRFPSGNFDKLYYVAIRDVVNRHEPELWTEKLAKAECIGRDQLPKKYEHLIEEQMEFLSEEWFHAYMWFADAQWSYAQKKLDKMLNIT